MDWDFDGEEFDEEAKLRDETRKILELPELPVSATSVRVPVLVGHAEAVWVETEEPLSPERATRCSTQRPASASTSFPTPGRRRRRRRRARRPDPPRPDGRERARAVRRRRQPAQGRRAERDPDRRAPARAPPRRDAAGARAPRSSFSLTAAAASSARRRPSRAPGGRRSYLAHLSSVRRRETAATSDASVGRLAVLRRRGLDERRDRGTSPVAAIRSVPLGTPRRLGREPRSGTTSREDGNGGSSNRLLPAAGERVVRNTLGSWRVIVLNSNCGPADGCGLGSPQWRWPAQ